jgi:hypothetical protein
MMNVVRLSRWSFAVLMLFYCTQGIAYGATPPTEELLPNTTKGYLSVPNVDQLEEAFNKTQMGQLANDPAMKPFIDDLKRQLREQWTKSHQKLGISWEDLDGVPAGRAGRRHWPPAANRRALGQD